MAIKTLSSLASALTPGVGVQRTQVTLYGLNPKDDTYDKNDSFAFQYFPASLSDSKAAEYESSTPAGSSLPIYGWKSSGARTLSFTATFTCDMDLLAPAGSSFGGGEGVFEELQALGEDVRNVDIRAAVAWLRKFLLPSYNGGTSDVGQVLTQAPRKAVLCIPGSGIGLAGGDDGVRSLITPDMVLCVMTQCDVEWKRFFPSGLPRIAEVQLAFEQCPQQGGYVLYPSNTDAFQDLPLQGGPAAQGPTKLYPYTLRGKP